MIPSDHVVPSLSDTPSQHCRYGTYPLVRSKKGKERGKAPFMSPKPHLILVRELTDKKVEQGSIESFTQLGSCREASIKLRRQRESCRSRASSLPIIPSPASSSSSPVKVVELPVSISTFGILPPIPKHRSTSVSEGLAESSPKERFEAAMRDCRREALNIRALVKDMDFTVLNDLTDCYIKQSKYEDAIAITDQVLSIDSMNGIAWKYRGLASFYQGNYKQALKCLRKARTCGVIDYLVLKTLGEIYLKKEKLPQAISYFEQACKNYPDLTSKSEDSEILELQKLAQALRNSKAVVTE